MNKKFLSAILFGALMVGSTGTFTSCKDYDDDIDGLEQRMDAVEKLVNDLKAKIESGAVITNVVSTSTGVTVTLSDGKTFNLTNGTNGTNGTDGKPGSVVSIGENGNWFIDGVDTGKPSRGEKGEAGEDGQPGQDGKPGEDGQPGQDGKPGISAPTIYYYPGVEGDEAGYWVKVTIAVDGTETKIVTTEKCLPEGTIGAVWDSENGYLILDNVKGYDGAIQIKLFGNLQSLAFVPEVIDTKLGMGVIDFYSILVPNKQNASKYDFVVTNTPTITYRLNPQNASIKSLEWSFINRVVETRVAGDNANLLSIVKSAAGTKGGMDFTVKANGNLSELKANEEAIVALQAYNKEENTEIVSDYAVVKVADLKQFSIINKDELPAKVVEYRTVRPDITAASDVTMLYTGSLNLYDITETWAKEITKTLPAIGVKPTYVFSKVDKYLGTDNKTDQQKFVTLDDKGLVKVDNEWLAQGTAAVGRTPLFEVSAKVNGVEIAHAFIKVKIVDKQAVEQGDYVLDVALGDIEYSSLAANVGNRYDFSWDRANSEVYDALGLTREQFMAKYVDYSAQTTPKGVTAYAWTFASQDPTETAMAWININPQVALGAGEVKVTYPAKDNYSNKNVVIKFTYNIVHEKALPDLNQDYLIGTNVIQVKGKMVGNSWKLVGAMKEQCKNYLDGYTLPNNHTKLFFRLKATTPLQTGAAISGGDWTNQEISLTTPLTEKEVSRDYKVEMVASLVNGGECVKEYIVRFVRPFDAKIDAFSLKTFQATADSKDLVDLVTITDKDGEVVYEKGAYTQYGKTVYKLDAAGISFAYKLKADTSFGDNLTLSGSTVTWYNQGNDLQQNKSAKSIAVITIPDIAKIEVEGNITVLSTANSK